jgi:ribose 5-phosphate isomerase A
MMNDRKRDSLKRAAGETAAGFVESGMVVGLGHGSTVVWALRLIARKLELGLLKDIVVVPCSSTVTEDARQAGLPLTSFEDLRAIDLTIDGADEVDPKLNLIKGRGGALLREKIVAQASRREIIVVDALKISPQLGSISGVPVEIIPFGYASQLRYLEDLGAEVSLRRSDDGLPYLTDQGNLVADCAFGPIEAPEELAAALQRRAGLVAHGLFLSLATDILVAEEQGVRHLTGKASPESGRPQKAGKIR